MAVNKEKYTELIQELSGKNVALIAVSKFKSPSDILELYNLGQRDFGENYVQELLEKHEELPNDIRWHFIGHLQSNKVKYIAPFIHLIHGVDSFNLLKAIDKEGAKNNRVIDILLQIRISQEETKYGLVEEELKQILLDLPDQQRKNICIKGFMGMASFTEDERKLKQEFDFLAAMFKKYDQRSIQFQQFQTLSIGMSNDYSLAIAAGSTMIRIGSLLFGRRT